MTKRLFLPAMALVAVGTLLFGVAPASAAGGHASFKATFSGSAVITSETTVSFSGSGSATHMGHITNDGNVVSTGSDDSCAGGVANVNTEVLTDNDGDTLTITSQDVACPTGPGQYQGTGRWTVVGGTGRFDWATGQGLLDGTSDFTTDTFTITLTGTLALLNG